MHQLILIGVCSFCNLWMSDGVFSMRNECLCLLFLFPSLMIRSDEECSDSGKKCWCGEKWGAELKWGRMCLCVSYSMWMCTDWIRDGNRMDQKPNSACVLYVWWVYCEEQRGVTVRRSFLYSSLLTSRELRRLVNQISHPCYPPHSLPWLHHNKKKNQDNNIMAGNCYFSQSIRLLTMRGASRFYWNIIPVTLCVREFPITSWPLYHHLLFVTLFPSHAVVFSLLLH